MNPGIFQIIFTYTKSFCNYGICLLTLIMFIQFPSGWLYSLPILNPILFFNWKCLAALLISCMSYEIFSYSHVVHFTQVLSHLSHNALDEYFAVPHFKWAHMCLVGNGTSAFWDLCKRSHRFRYYRLSIYHGTIRNNITHSQTTSKVQLQSHLELTKDGHTLPWQVSYWCPSWGHYNGVIMGVMASQITSLMIVYLTVY